MVSSLTEKLEAEPNDEEKSATAVELPAGINGRLQASGDRDYFRFSAKKGDRWIFTGQARQYDSPADLFLRIFQADKRLAEVDDTGMDEGRLDFTAPADGEYAWMVADLTQRGGPEFVYRVEAARFAPSFQLALDVDKVDVPQQGWLVMKVTAARSGYDGPIELAVHGLPDKCEISGETIAEKKNDTTLKIRLPEKTSPGALFALTVTGTGKAKDQALSATANSMAAWRKATPNLLYPDLAWVETVGVGVGPVFPKFFEISVAKKELSLAEDAKELKVKVSLKRLEKFADALTGALEGLP